MSGLLGFFSKFVPARKNAGVDDEYDKSLLDLPSRTDDAMIEDPELPKCSENPLDFQAWKKQRNEYLQRFLDKRMNNDDDDDDDDDDDSDSSDDPLDEAMAEDPEDLSPMKLGDNENPESQNPNDNPETQQQQQQTPSSKQRNRKRQKQRIPRLSETVHDVTLLEDIDLHTRQVSLDLVRVTKVFDLRDIRRFAVTEAYEPRHQAILQRNDDTAAWKHLMHQPLDDDGPLSTIYDGTVLSLEIEQLHLGPLHPARRAAAAAAEEDSDAQHHHQQQEQQARMRLFFYNDYATIVSHVFEDFHPRTHNLLLQLSQIPARCIFPYDYGNWYEQQDMAPYCLAIGGESRMRMSDSSEFTRFDSQELAVDFMVEEKESGEVREWSVSNQSQGYRVGHPAKKVLDLYKTWKERNDIPANELTEDTETAVAQQHCTNAEALPGNTERTSGDTVLQQPITAAAVPQEEKPRNFGTYVPLNALREALDTHNRWKAKKAAVSKVCQVDLFGVVIGFSAPTLTKRGDQKVTVTLIDEAICDGDGEQQPSPVTLVIFSKAKKYLPVLLCAGNILRLHRVVIQDYQGDLQLRGQRSTGYVVYGGNCNEGRSFDSKSITSPGMYNVTAAEAARFTDLWNWGQTRLANYSTIKQSEQRTLEQIGLEEDRGIGIDDDGTSVTIGDFTVMISAIIPMAESQKNEMTPVGFLRVWDGTGPSKSDRFPGAINPLRGDPPSEALVAISKICEGRTGQDRKPLTAPERLCGRVVNVVIWEEALWDIIRRPEVAIGGFIRLRNVGERFLKELGFRCLHATPRSWLTPLPPATFDVLELLFNHGERIAKKHATNPSSGVLPLPLVDRNSTIDQGREERRSPVAPPRKPQRPRCASLQQLVSNQSNAVFRGQVVIKNTIPRIEDPSELRALCPVVDKTKGTRCFRFGLCLNDGNTSLDAIIANSVGASFFLGMSAEEACEGRVEDAFAVLSCIVRRKKFRVAVRSVCVDGAKYFLVTSISAVAT